MRAIIIIPARLDSRRLRNKALVEIDGAPMVSHAYSNARRCDAAEYVVVTSPDKRVIEYCIAENMAGFPTAGHDIPTGTHRCAELLKWLDRKSHFDVIVNWQVDEVRIDTDAVDGMIEELGETARDPFDRTVRTLYYQPPADDEDFQGNENRTKVRIAGDPARCLDFTRVMIPGAMEHVGIYGFSHQSLESIGELAPTTLSQLESLEQLAWLEAGLSIFADRHVNRPWSLNTPDDVRAYGQMLADGR